MPGPLSTGPAPRWTVESDPQQLAPEWSGSAKPAMTLRQRAGPDQHRGKEPRQLLTRHAAEASADPRGGQPGVRFPETRSPNAETDPSRSERLPAPLISAHAGLPHFPVADAQTGSGKESALDRGPKYVPTIRVASGRRRCRSRHALPSSGTRGQPGRRSGRRRPTTRPDGAAGRREPHAGRQR